MKALTVLLLMLSLGAGAQTKIEKTIPWQKGQAVRLWFDYPNLIRVTTWDKNEIGITGTVNINFGESDDAFQLDTKTSPTTVSVKGSIRDMDRLPKKYVIVQGGKKMLFSTKSDLKKYQSEHGASQFTNMGVDVEIELEIKVPKGAETDVESVYGMVEVRDFVGPIAVLSTYGGVDAALTEKNVGELVAETNYGEIYSNLDAQPSGRRRDEDFHTVFESKPGSGPRYRFESPYGNVYLRKSVAQ